MTLFIIHTAIASNISRTIAAKKHVVEIQKPKYFGPDEEFVRLESLQPMSDGFAFTTKGTKKGLQRQNQRFLCPDTIAEMMVIVKDLQNQRYCTLLF